MRPLGCIVLAAGEGSRFKSGTPKPLHTIAGRTMLERVLITLRKLKPQQITVVVGVGRERVAQTLATYPEVTVAVQEHQLGTGHAVDCARQLYSDFEGDILVTCADIPLVQAETLQHLHDEHHRQNAAATILTTHMPDPTGYGRVVRDAEGLVERVVEHRDADEQTLALDEISSGIFCFRADRLFEALSHLDHDNAQGEYYLPGVLSYLRANGEAVAACVADDPDEVMGINDRVQLAEAERICRDRIRIRLMREGVTLLDPPTIYIDEDVEVGRDTVIWPGTCLVGRTQVGSGCEIGAHVLLHHAAVGDACRIHHCSAIIESSVENDVEIGPFAHVRANSTIRSSASVNSYCEVVRSEVGEGTKSRHFSYLGDTIIGRGANIGAGTITCNYDGVKKHRTVIGDGAFIGSDTILVAPVTIGKRAYTGAGSVITHDVPDDSLAIARARQSIIERWAQRRRAAGTTD